MDSFRFGGSGSWIGRGASLAEEGRCAGGTPALMDRRDAYPTLEGKRAGGTPALMDRRDAYPTLEGKRAGGTPALMDRRDAYPTRPGREKTVFLLSPIAAFC